MGSRSGVYLHPGGIVTFGHQGRHLRMVEGDAAGCPACVPRSVRYRVEPRSDCVRCGGRGWVRVTAESLA